MSKDHITIDIQPADIQPAGQDRSRDVIEDARASLFRDTDFYLSKCNFKQALLKILLFAQDTNQYLDRKSPWKVIKEDRQAAADSLYVALYAISCLKMALYPFLPFSSQKVHEYLGFEGRIEDYGWKPQPPPPGQRLREPRPLFVKLDDSIIEEETKLLGRG